MAEFGDIPVRDGLASVLGIVHDEISAERPRAHFEVSDSVRQIYGIVHGGAYAALAETLASAATAAAVADDGMLAMGQTNSTTFLRPVSEGTVQAVATPRHRGRTSWVWDVEMTDSEGRQCAIARLIIAVRPRP